MDFNHLTEKSLLHPVVKTSDEWYKLLHPSGDIIIMDPDGWDRAHFQYSYYEELITRKDFEMRLMMSTCMHQAAQLNDPPVPANVNAPWTVTDEI